MEETIAIVNHELKTRLLQLHIICSRRKICPMYIIIHMVSILRKNTILGFAPQYKYKSMHKKTHELLFSGSLSVISLSKFQILRCIYADTWIRFIANNNLNFKSIIQYTELL